MVINITYLNKKNAVIVIISKNMNIKEKTSAK